MLDCRLVVRREGFTLEAAFLVAAGETLVLAGESGAGKSTLLRALAGLYDPAAGHIAVDGVRWFDRAAGISLAPDRRSVGWVPQDLALFPHLPVLDNVAFGLRARGERGSRARARAREALARVGVADLAARRPGQLSGGQQQRVALARALAGEPRLLLLDEPLSALDLPTRRAVRGELRRLLAELPCTTVLVTHNAVEALLFGDRIAVLEGGRIAQEGNRDELLRRPRSGYVAEFMGVNLLRGQLRGHGGDGLAEVLTADGPVIVAAPANVEGEIFVAVSPREITLYREAPVGSARNLYRGPVLEMVPEPPFGERVRVVLGTHPRLVADVTREAAVELGLTEGDEVYASFKATGTVTYP